MIRGLGPVPTEWDQEQLLARLDTDCYLVIHEGLEAFSILRVYGDLDAPEAMMDRPDVAALLSSVPSRLCTTDYRDTEGRQVRAVFGRSNQDMLEIAHSMGVNTNH